MTLSTLIENGHTLWWLLPLLIGSTAFGWLLIFHSGMREAQRALNATRTQLEAQAGRSLELVSMLLRFAQKEMPHDRTIVKELRVSHALAQKAHGIQALAAIGAQLNEALERFFVAAEANDRMRHDVHFIALQKAIQAHLQKREQMLQQFRALAHQYNERLRTCPIQPLLKLLGYRRAPSIDTPSHATIQRAEQLTFSEDSTLSLSLRANSERCTPF